MLLNTVTSHRLQHGLSCISVEIRSSHKLACVAAESVARPSYNRLGSAPEAGRTPSRGTTYVSCLMPRLTPLRNIRTADVHKEHLMLDLSLNTRDSSLPPAQPALYQRRNTDCPQARVHRRTIRG